MKKRNKKVKKSKLKFNTHEEWKKLGLPESVTTIHFGKPPWVKKLQELKKK